MKVLRWLLLAVVVVLAFAWGQLDVAISSIRFDLRKIGESVYEARQRSGQWPARVEDLEGTVYLTMPYRRTALEQGVFVVVWPRDLAAEPRVNGDRVLAYSSGGLLARFGMVWACRGDLRVERIGASELAAIRSQAR